MNRFEKYCFLKDQYVLRPLMSLNVIYRLMHMDFNWKQINIFIVSLVNSLLPNVISSLPGQGPSLLSLYVCVLFDRHASNAPLTEGVTHYSNCWGIRQNNSKNKQSKPIVALTCTFAIISYTVQMRTDLSQRRIYASLNCVVQGRWTGLV